MSASSLLLLGFLALASPLVSAQNDYIINKIDIPTAGNGTATIGAGNGFLSFINATVADSFVYADHTGSFELMAGDKGSNNVVDIICVNQDPFVFACNYIFLPSLPAGQYHYRVNITNDNNNSALSDPFQVTAASFDCLTPPAMKNITSISDPNYRSIQIEDPAAGAVGRLDGSTYVTWGYRDIRNKEGANISNLQFEFVSEKTGQAFGNHVASSDDFFITQFSFDFPGTGVSVGAWRVRGNYSSPFENGSKTVSTLSEVFYIEGTNSLQTCDGLGKSSTTKNGGLRRFGEGHVVKVLLSSLSLILFFWFC